MNTHKSVSILIALVIGLSAITVGCSTGATKQGKAMAESGQNIFTVETASGLTVNDVEKVVLKALSNRGWTVTSQTPGEINADLNQIEKRSIHGIIVINYTEKLITIRDKSVNDKGEPFVPVRWITHLVRDMKNGMGIAVN